MKELTPDQLRRRKMEQSRRRSRKAAGGKLVDHRANQYRIADAVNSSKKLFTELKSLVPPDMQVCIDKEISELGNIDAYLYNMRPKYLGAVVEGFFDDPSIKYPFPVIDEVIGVEAAPASAAKDAGEASAKPRKRKGSESAVAISACVALLSDTAEEEPSAVGDKAKPKKRKRSESVLIKTGEVLSAREMALLQNPEFVAAIKHLATIV